MILNVSKALNFINNCITMAYHKYYLSKWSLSHLQVLLYKLHAHEHASVWTHSLWVVGILSGLSLSGSSASVTRYAEIILINQNCCSNLSVVCLVSKCYFTDDKTVTKHSHAQFSKLVADDSLYELNRHVTHIRR